MKVYCKNCKFLQTFPDWFTDNELKFLHCKHPKYATKQFYDTPYKRVEYIDYGLIKNINDLNDCKDYEEK